MTLIRIVRMTFRSEEIENFRKVFDENKGHIRAFPGCNYLELHQDIDQPDILSTYSLWDSPEALENYRHSDLFRTVWAKTKVLFADKPEAFSHRVLEALPD